VLSVGKSGFFEPTTNQIGAASANETTAATAVANAGVAAAGVRQAEDSVSDNSQDARAAKKQAKLDARRVRISLLLGLFLYSQWPRCSSCMYSVYNYISYLLLCLCTTVKTPTLSVENSSTSTLYAFIIDLAFVYFFSTI